MSLLIRYLPVLMYSNCTCGVLPKVGSSTNSKYCLLDEYFITTYLITAYNLPVNEIYLRNLVFR